MTGAVNREPDLVQARRLISDAPCHVVLPAGCGKTEVVASVAAAAWADGQRVLLLTHTHAGIDALRARLAVFRVPRSAVGLTTIASWTRRLVTSYPAAAECDAANSDWSQVCAGAGRALSNPHLAAMVRGSYDLVLVDEYQDCTRPQHMVVLALNELRPVIVFGDPLQAIYSFGNEPLVSFAEMRPLRAVSLPCVGWRWRGRNDHLGEYLFQARDALLAGSPVDLRTDGLNWIEATPENTRKALWKSVSATGDVTVLARFDAQCEAIAKRLGGRFDVMEDIEGTRLVRTAAIIDEADGARPAGAVLALAKASMAKLPTTLTNKLKSLQAGRFPAFRAGTPVYAPLRRLQEFAERPDAQSLLVVLDELDRVGGVVCRHEACSDFRRAVLVWHQGAESLSDAVRAVRDRNRIFGRRVARRTVSRAVLVKGQEFDHCIVTTPEEMTPEELYVAMTRGTRSLTVLSPDPILRPVSATAARMS
jgi:hypothetical protein